MALNNGVAKIEKVNYININIVKILDTGITLYIINYIH